MSEFREIRTLNGFSAHQLGRDGEPTGGWRIEHDGEVLAECPHEVGARIMLFVLACALATDWELARDEALRDMGFRRAA